MGFYVPAELVKYRSEGFAQNANAFGLRSRRFQSYAQKGVPHYMWAPLPDRPKRRDDLDLL